MRRAGALLALSTSVALCGTSCVSDQVLSVEIRPPRAPDGGLGVPTQVVSWELRLVRLDEAFTSCPSVDEAARAREGVRLGHAQAFRATDEAGSAIGEVPEGRWALAALGRDASCGVVLYGCSEVMIGPNVPSVLVVEVQTALSTARCGCRTCADGGVCTPVATSCE